MKRKLLNSIAVVAVIVALTFIMSSTFGKEYDKSNVGREVSIGWEIVNLREDYSTNSDVIAELHHGEKIVLTGHSYEYFDGPDSSWIQVQSGNQIGWIVRSAIDWL